MKFGTVVLQLNTLWLTKSNFRYDVRLLIWWPWHHFTQKSAAIWWEHTKHLPVTYSALSSSSWSKVHSCLFESCHHLFQLLVFLWVSFSTLSCDDCLEDKSEDYQNCSVLYCVPQLYTVIRTHIWAVLTCVLASTGFWFSWLKPRHVCPCNDFLTL